MITHEQIKRLAVGDEIAQVSPTRNSLPVPESRIGPFRRIVEIFARGTDLRGREFVCCYTEFGQNSQISASLKEGEGHYVIRETV